MKLGIWGWVVARRTLILPEPSGVTLVLVHCDMTLLNTSIPGRFAEQILPLGTASLAAASPLSGSA